jgi:hypothetical protein
MWLYILVLLIILVIVWCKKPVSYWISPENEEFFHIASEILENSSWRKNHKIYQKPDKPADVEIYLTPDREIDYSERKYPSGKKIKYSVTNYGSDPIRIDINEDNWREGVAESGLSLPQYRKYVVEHEMGHALGYDHVECDVSTVGSFDNRCPVMHQSTVGCGKFKCGYSPDHGNFDPKSAPKLED